MEITCAKRADNVQHNICIINKMLSLKFKKAQIFEAT